MPLASGTDGFVPPSTEESAHGLGVGQVNGQPNTGHDHHPRTDHLDVAGGSAQEVDHHLATHAHQHGDGDHQNEQAHHETGNSEADGGCSKGAEEDDEGQHGSGGAVDGSRSVADPVQVHVAAGREGLVGLGGAVLVDQILDKAHHVRGDTEQHHGTEHNQQECNEDGDVVDDARFCKGFSHDQSDDTDDAKEGPHAKAGEHTDVERTRHAGLEFSLLNQLVFTSAKGEVVGDESGKYGESAR